MSKKVYIFTATSFHDEYKLKGTSSSINDILAVFSTLERACDYERYWLDDYVRTYYENNICDNDKEDGAYDVYKNGDGSLRRDLDDYELRELAEKFSDEEFFPVRMEWGVKEVIVDLFSTPVLEHGQPEQQEEHKEEEESPLKRVKTV